MPTRCRGLPAALSGLALLAALTAVRGQESTPEARQRLAARFRELDRQVITNHMMGRPAEAARLAAEQVEVARRLYPAAKYPDGHRDLAVALGLLATMLDAQGEAARAEPLHRQALQMCRTLFPPKDYPDGHHELAVSANNLGLFLLRQGEFSQAEALLRESLAARRRFHARDSSHQKTYELATALNNLAAVYLHRREHARAVPLLREAAALRRRLYPNGSRGLALNLTNLGTALLRVGDASAAEPLLREALAMRRSLFPPEKFPRGHADVLAALNNLGTLLNAQGKHAEAAAVFDEALAMCRDLYPRDKYPEGSPGAVVILSNVAFCWERRGEYQKAAPLAREALAVYEAQVAGRAGVAAEAEALNFVASLPLARDAYLSVTAHLPPDPAVYEGVWDSKAALTRVLEARHRDSLASADPQTRDLARRLREARRDLARAAQAPVADAGAHARRLKALTDAKEVLEQQLARRLDLAAPARGGARATPAALRDLLPDKAVFIDLVRYRALARDHGSERLTARYAAFVLCRDGRPRRVELGEAEPIEQALRQWRRELSAGRADGRAPAGHAPEHRLGELVWQPLARHLPAGTQAVYLAPDADLTALPWAALPGRARGKVLLEEHALALVPHGPFLLEQLRAGRAAAAGPGAVLAVGALAYGRRPNSADRPAGAAVAAPVRGGRASWDDLEGTRRELDQVLAHAGRRDVVVRRGTEASVAQVCRDLERARYAHLATHGFFDKQGTRSVLQLSEEDYHGGRWGERIGAGKRSPLLLSGLVLSGANCIEKGRPETYAADGGILLGEAIVGLNLHRMELAVLSACETGLGDVAGGEGVFGLQRAFHVAGCKNVVASLWQVDDEATAALMALFYHKLWAEKLPPIEALRQAQLTLYRHPERIPALARARGPDFDRVANRPAGERPSAARAPARLWAGFVLSGAGR
jgi:CHAT domain-containing protein/Tfp pilus assembly protein PilF